MTGLFYTSRLMAFSKRLDETELCHGVGQPINFSVTAVSGRVWGGRRDHGDPIRLYNIGTLLLTLTFQEEPMIWPFLRMRFDGSATRTGEQGKILRWWQEVRR